ncbi:MAG: hypothetical protein U9N13_08530 [Euryarchaeota archaeon]|nr:hypothetical protein [Euryarchaeota archaeon]
MSTYAEVFQITAADIAGGDGQALLPGGEYIWMIIVLVIAVLALWQARKFVTQF